MSYLSRNVMAAFAIFRRDFLIFTSYRLRVLTQLLGTFFSLTLFYYISRLVTVEAFPSPDAYYAFAVVGLIILQVLNSTLAGPPTNIRQELVAGTFERFVISPFGPIGSLIATLLFPCLFAMAMGIAMLGFGALVFGLSIEWSTAPLAIPLAFLGSAAFAPFGLVLLGLVLVLKAAPTGTTWIVAGISLIAGLYFPVTLLPDWIQWASDVQPFTPAVELMRHVLVDTPLSDPVWLGLTKLVGFSVVTWPITLWLVRRAVQVARRRGTIIEY